MDPVNAHPVLEWITTALDLLSATFGMVGTYYMAKKYASSFTSGIKFAFVALWFYITRRGAQVAKVYNSDYQGNRDIPDIPSDMALGLKHLFLAFFLQVAKIILPVIAAKL